MADVFEPIPPIEPIRSKLEPIPAELWTPERTDRRFLSAVGGRTIFLAEGIIIPSGRSLDAQLEEAGYVSSRDMTPSSYSLLPVAYIIAQKAVGNTNTAAFHEAVLQHTLQRDEVQLQHIITGLDQSTRAPFRLFGITLGPRK